MSSSKVGAGTPKSIGAPSSAKLREALRGFIWGSPESSPMLGKTVSTPLTI